jgi:hypothetical protein
VGGDVSDADEVVPGLRADEAGHGRTRQERFDSLEVYPSSDFRFVLSGFVRVFYESDCQGRTSSVLIA